ncbi:MAG: hypothetical protein PVG52_11780 [Desulfobacterales bacterium]
MTIQAEKRHVAAFKLHLRPQKIISWVLKQKALRKSSEGLSIWCPGPELNRHGT